MQGYLQIANLLNYKNTFSKNIVFLGNADPPQNLNKMIKKTYTLFCLLICFNFLTAQNQADSNTTLFLETEIISDNQIKLSWLPMDDVSNYFVFERESLTGVWSEIAELPSDATEIVLDSPSGTWKEYRVFRFAATSNTNGYTTSGIEAETQTAEKDFILVVTDVVYNESISEIEDYLAQIESEDNHIEMIIVSEDDPVTEVKSQIVNLYRGNKTNLLLLGHVPVPYSGNLGPDGHSNHVGAWPSDGYYGDVDGIWTDEIVNNTSGSQTRTHNIPGDGKFDQSTFPSFLEMAVGRVDFKDMPVFEASETELIKAYLAKNLAYRRGEIETVKRGLVDNNFGLAEGFGQNGFKNFSVILGIDSTYAGTYSDLYETPYMWSYGAGGGNYQGASGIASSTDFSENSVQTIFTMLFGSFFGDWDSPTNNFLKASLATGTTLSNVWAGRPHYYFHPMALGGDLGDCILISMNNITSYDGGFGRRGVHMALMGDPSLKMNYVQGTEGVEASQVEGAVSLEWKESPADNILYYDIYKNDAFIARVNAEQITYVDPCNELNEINEYGVEAIGLETTASGSYLNRSPRVNTQIEINTATILTAEIELIDIDGLTVSLAGNTVGANSATWDFGDGNSATEEDVTHTFSEPGEYEIVLTVFNDCREENTSIIVNVGSSTNTEDFDPEKNLETIIVSQSIDLSQTKLDFRHEIDLIYLADGKLISRTGAGQTEMDLGGMLTGYYLLRDVEGRQQMVLKN